MGAFSNFNSLKDIEDRGRGFLGKWGGAAEDFTDKTTPEWWRDALGKIGGSDLQEYQKHIGGETVAPGMSLQTRYQRLRDTGSSKDAATKQVGTNLGTSAAILAMIFGGSAAAGSAGGSSSAGSGALGSGPFSGTGNFSLGGTTGAFTPAGSTPAGASFGGGGFSLANAGQYPLGALGSNLGPISSQFAGGLAQGTPMNANAQPGQNGFSDILQQLGQGQGQGSSGQAPQSDPGDPDVNVQRPQGGYNAPKRTSLVGGFRSPVAFVNRGAFMRDYY